MKTVNINPGKEFMRILQRVLLLTGMIALLYLAYQIAERFLQGRKT